MIQHLQKHRKLLFSCLFTLVLTSTVSFNLSAFAHISRINSSFKPNETNQLISLKEGEIIVTGDRGKYTGKLLIKAPLKTAWAVLTDYNNFKNFLPNVANSQVIESKGNRKVFEQTNIIQALFFSKEITFRIASTETYPQQIAFKVVSGDVKSLDGFWKFQIISDKILIEHEVNIDPGDGGERELFFMIYKDNLEQNLKAIKQEIKRRSLS